MAGNCEAPNCPITDLKADIRKLDTKLDTACEALSHQNVIAARLDDFKDRLIRIEATQDKNGDEIYARLRTIETGFVSRGEMLKAASILVIIGEMAVECGKWIVGKGH